jgi:hypothetical protein
MIAPCPGKISAGAFWGGSGWRLGLGNQEQGQQTQQEQGREGAPRMTPAAAAPAQEAGTLRERQQQRGAAVPSPPHMLPLSTLAWCTTP